MITGDNLLTDTLKTARPVFVYMLLFSFFINLLQLTLPLYSLQVLDRVLATGSMDTLFWLTVIMVAAFLVAGFLQAMRSFSLIRTGEWIESTLGRSLLTLGLTHAAATGARGTQNLRDLGTVKTFLTGGGLLTLMDAPWSVIALLAIFAIHVQLGMVTVLGCLLLLGLAWINEVAMHQPLDEASEHNVKNMQQVDVAMRNAEAIEAMGMTGTVADAWERVSRRITSLQSLASYRSSIVQAVTKCSRLTIQISITGWGAWLTLHNEMTAGGIIAGGILAGRALMPFDAAIGIWKNLVEARKSYRRLSGALDRMAAHSPGISLPIPEGRLSVEKLVYAAPGRSKPILKGINFALEPGESLGIIGPSAAGKSTLAKLIVGTWKPYGGVVRLDGGDVCHWKRDEFGRYTGYLPQDIELFSGRVRDNIARLQDGAPDEAVVQAAQLAEAHELIMALPEGYDTDIGPSGTALSAGQRQRIGLARAFFGVPRLLVLDEPDASLDGEGEKALARALQNARTRQITTLVISHRRNLLAHVDKLLVLKDGEGVMFGPKDQVMEALAPREVAVPPAGTQRVSRPARKFNAKVPRKESKHAAA